MDVIKLSRDGNFITFTRNNAVFTYSLLNDLSAGPQSPRVRFIFNHANHSFFATDDVTIGNDSAAGKTALEICSMIRALLPPQYDISGGITP